jgi:hypothetical protein
MKKFHVLLLCIFISITTYSQTIVVSGQCIAGSITATFVGNESGRPSYLGTGTIAGFPNTQLAIFWLPAPDNLWVIAFDGQPFYTNACNTMVVPGTSPNICQWQFLAGNPACTGAALSVSGAVVLPVTLTGLSATAVNNTVIVKWNTQQEVNNSGFTIQRSSNGQQWSDIGFVAGAGNSSTVLSYSFTDNAPLAGTNFYRLVQRDIDGRTSISDVVTADIGTNKFFTLSDNPGNGTYRISMPASAEMLELQVTDASGKVIINRKTGAGNQLIDISNYSPGIYLLRMKKGKELATVKLIKL